MNISEKDSEAIRQIVDQYCEEHEIIPAGSRLIVSLTLELSSNIEIRTQTADPLLNILQQSALILWDIYREKNGIRSKTRVRDLLLNSGSPTMYQLVTRHEFEVRKYRNFGNKSFSMMTAWLKSYDLKFGMVFPKEIEGHFCSSAPPIRTDTLADLIARNLDETD